MKTKNSTLEISSPDFQSGGIIPKMFSCRGSNISPALRIDNIPKNARYLALIMDDPDATKGTFTHWVMWNILPNQTIEQNNCPGIVGKNGKGERKYTGPCPPSGTHNYHFKVYAIDTFLDLEGDADKDALLNAMQGHIVAQGELIGKYRSEK